MRLAVLLSRVPRTDECDRHECTDDVLLAMVREHELLVCVDEDTAGSDRLRAAGVTVHVADKRHLHLPGGRELDSDEVLADWLVARHRETPLDRIVASCTRGLHLLDEYDDLAGVPRAILLDGPLAQPRRLLDDPGWLGEHAEELWLASSRAATATCVVGTQDPACWGLDAPPAARLLPAVEPAPGAIRGAVVLLATDLSLARAASLHARLSARIDLDGIDSLVVVHGPDVRDATPLGPVVLDALPQALATRTIVVPGGREAMAGGFVRSADALVVDTVADLGIPLVAERATTTPTLVLDDGGAVTDVLTAMPPVRARVAAAQLVPLPASPAELIDVLDRFAAQAATDRIVLHTPGSTQTALRVLERRGDRAPDVVLGARTAPPFGTPDPSRAVASVLSLHRRVWPAVRALLHQGLEVAALPSALAAQASLGGFTVEFVPAVGPAAAAALGVGLYADHRPLVGLHAVLATAPAPATAAPRPPAPVVEDDEPAGPSLRAWVKETRWAGRAALALPWRLGLGRRVASGELPDAVRDWVKDHRAADRVRLALPWKWGLLPRAMEDRW